MSLSQAIETLKTYTAQLTITEQHQLNCADFAYARSGVLTQAHLQALQTMTERLMFEQQGREPIVLDMTYLFAQVKGLRW